MGIDEDHTRGFDDEALRASQILRLQAMRDVRRKGVLDTACGDEECHDIDEGSEDEEDVLKARCALRLAIRGSVGNISGLDAAKRSKVASDADGEWEDIDEEQKQTRCADHESTTRGGAKS